MSINVHKADLLQSIESPSHSIRVDIAVDPATVELSAESVRMDRDFILYLGYRDLAAMSHAYRSESRYGDFIQLDLALQSEDRQLTSKREIVFVLDCSGSMQGDSIAEAKKALEICLKGLEPGTGFNIYRFGSTFERLFKKTAIYDEETLGFALDYLRGKGADLGGTLILGPLKDIYSRKIGNRSSGRDVILITDGEVANDDEVLALVGSHSDTTRVFALGIGAGPNEYLIRGLAKAAHGVSGFIFPGERIEPKVLGMFRDVMGTCAEDVSIEWGRGSATQAPDLPVIFMGRPTTVFAHYRKAKRKPGEVTLRGIVNGQEKSWQVKIDEAGSHQLPISTLWARERVRDLEASGASLAIKGSRQVGRKSKQLRKTVIDISRQFGVLSRFTSYVAVEKRKGKDRTKGEVVLRKVPALVTVGWHGIGDVGLPLTGVTFPTLSAPRMMAYIELPQNLARPSALGRGGRKIIREHSKIWHEIRKRLKASDRSLMGYDFFPADEEPQLVQAARMSRTAREAARKRSRRQDILLKMLELQQAGGGFDLDNVVAGRLGLKIKDLRKLAEKIEVDVEVDRFRLLCTAVILKTLAIHFAAARPVWEGAAAKSIKWLNHIVTEGSPRLEKKLLMEWADDFTRRKVKIKT
jgi:Ca-activated chloride channel family protein